MQTTTLPLPPANTDKTDAYLLAGKSLVPVRSTLEGEAVQTEPVAQTQNILHPYGVGIDVHSKFIQVCVLLVPVLGVADAQVLRWEKDFPTTWKSLLEAHAWVLAHLPAGTDPFDIWAELNCAASGYYKLREHCGDTSQDSPLSVAFGSGT